MERIGISSRKYNRGCFNGRVLSIFYKLVYLVSRVYAKNHTSIAIRLAERLYIVELLRFLSIYLKIYNKLAAYIYRIKLIKSYIKGAVLLVRVFKLTLY